MTLLDWTVYAVAVSAVIGLTAWSLDALFRVMSRSSRWIWLAAMTLSVGVPCVALLTESSPPATSPTSARVLDVPFETNSSRLTAAAIVLRTTGTLLADAQGWLARAVVRVGDDLSSLPLDEASIKRGWAAASLALVLVLGVAFGRISYAARGWERRTLLGREVWISRAVGPAALGMFRPRVVLPEWAAKLEPNELNLVLSHEEEHARVRDPMLMGLAWIPVVAMPWNPFLWWQFRGLGRAVEVDCDRRVLRKGASKRDYLALLVRLAARAREDHDLMPSVARFASPLKARMEAMTQKRRSSRLCFSGALAMALMFLVVACGPGVPEAIRQSTAPPQYDPIRVFRSLPRVVFTLDARGDLILRAVQPEDVVQDSTPRRISVPLLPPVQDTVSTRACEYWRVNPDGTTSTGPGLVQNARCIPREDVGRVGGIMTIGVPENANPPACVYWLPNPDSLITRPGVIWYGQCGPRERSGTILIP